MGKDSLKRINMPLKKYGESFKLSLEKEIMPYKNIEKHICFNIISKIVYAM